MGNDSKQCGGPSQTGAIVGPVWFAAWLFTIGFVRLSFWKAVFALIIWPYFLGAALK